ncbi:hypothetical protein N7U49_48045 (plasmid) [Streptomyces sp. AD2-2]|nr:hypothetical protein N7U49_48045 [Streptomyces sp. AD2-2]
MISIMRLSTAAPTSRRWRPRNASPSWKANSPKNEAGQPTSSRRASTWSSSWRNVTGRVAHHTADGGQEHDVLTLIVPCTCGNGYITTVLDGEQDLVDAVNARSSDAPLGAVAGSCAVALAAAVSPLLRATDDG